MDDADGVALALVVLARDIAATIAGALDALPAVLFADILMQQRLQPVERIQENVLEFVLLFV